MRFKLKYFNFEVQQIFTKIIESESWNGCIIEFTKDNNINKLIEIKKIEP